jgi:hypothetical protein
MEAALIAKINNTMPVHFKALAVDSDGLLTSVETRTISGYGAVFNNKDSYGDILIKGCFAKSISERGPESSTNRKVAFLWMHDMDEPLGRITKLIEDDKGLYFEAELDKIPEADRALEQLNSGTLNQFSIGFMYVWDKMEYDEAQDAFIIKEVNLFEVSVVTIGANELTCFEGMKSEALESERNKLMRDTERILKSMPNEQQYAVRKLISKHIALCEAKPQKALKQEEPPQFDISESIKTLKLF